MRRASSSAFCFRFRFRAAPGFSLDPCTFLCDALCVFVGWTPRLDVGLGSPGLRNVRRRCGCRSLAYFVEQKGMSPCDARAEIRRINNEVFKLVLEASATIMSTGASISAMNATMRTMSPRIVARAGSTAWRVRFKPLNGKVNVGGGRETPDMTNLNAGNPTSGGPPVSAIPNLVHARMEQMDEMFEPGSVTYLYSRKIRYGDFDWPRGAKAAFNVMAPGGKVEMHIMCDADEGIRFLVPAFEKAGFKNVRSDMFGPATKIHAVR